MGLRFFLAVIGLALIPTILAAIGNHLAANVISDEKLRMSLKRWIWGLAIISILLVGISQWIAINDGTRHESQIGYLVGQMGVLTDVKSQIGDTAASLRELVQLHRVRPQTPTDEARPRISTTPPEDPLKHLSNDVIRQRTIELAKKMRDFEKMKKIEDINLTIRPPYPPDATEKEKHLAWELGAAQFLRRSTERQTEFKNQFLSEALNLEESLLSRLGKPMPPIIERPPALAPAMLVGPSPISDAADYLERLARQL